MSKFINLSGLRDKIDFLDKGKKTLLLKSAYEGAIDLSGGEIQNLC